MMRKHKITLDKEFELEAGGRLNGVDIVYHTSDREYREGDVVVWICHALTANSDPEDWWADMVGPGKAFDTEKYFVICANNLGSPYGTTGPASVNPVTGRLYMLDFPKYTVRDIVKFHIELSDYLGIGTIDYMVGSSIGGFQAVEWAIIEPERVKHLFLIATSCRATPYLTAYNESQRMAIDADVTFREAADLSGGDAGMRCARSIALISYRSKQGYDLTQSEADEDTIFADRAASYQRYQGKKLSDRFDAYCYWFLTYLLDSHNVGRGRGGVARALSSIKAETDVVAVDSDCIFPPYEMAEMAEMIPGASFQTITSAFGHDGFLLEYEKLTKIVKNADR